MLEFWCEPCGKEFSRQQTEPCEAGNRCLICGRLLDWRVEASEQWVRSVASKRGRAACKVIDAARQVRMIMMDGEYHSDFKCLRDLHDALCAYDRSKP